MERTLRLILGDQLNINHSWYNEVNPNTTYCMFEMRQETDYTTHHIQKVIGFFAAMRDFKDQLTALGHRVVYYEISDPENTQHLDKNLDTLIGINAIEIFEYQLPDEYRLDEQLKRYCQSLSIANNTYDTEHFYTKRNELSQFFKGKKQYLMESFYRYMRKKHQILVINDQPLGGQWNYDKNNRKKWDEKTMPPPFKWYENPVSELYDTITKSSIKTIGHANKDTFHYPINRQQALEQVDYFIEYLLVHFGDFQDAMHTNEVYLFHSRISFALNIKLIHPQEVIDKAITFYQDNIDTISLSQIEGFIRQIIGWREYMRGMYWMLMPDFKTKNHLNNANPLPDFYWSAETKMNCLKHSIKNSLDNAYAHHIQRLMITGNYALLTQTNPDDVDQWYLGIYADAVEWVQITNTRGMSQFADGGMIATKPYISSANYIDKMSNYCKSCSYNKKEKIGDNACPFNALYWNFLDDKRALLSTNHRMRMMYSLLNKIPREELISIKERANHIIKNPNAY